MKILFAASEAFPFCKTGGLADVAGSLPVSLAENGDQVAVILPLYDKIPYEWRQRMVYRSYIYVDVAWRHQYCGLFVMEYRGVTWYFVDNEHYFRRGRLYGEYDDGILWNDPDIGVAWPLEQVGGPEKVILADKDQNLQTFAQFMDSYGGF